MYRVIAKHTRPNTSVEFFNPKTSTLISDELKNYIGKNYMVTGKLVHSEETISENGLDLNLTAIYQDEATYNEFRNDTTIVEQLYAVGAAYREANGITYVIVSEESI
jgi:hypothetical protein